MLILVVGVEFRQVSVGLRSVEEQEGAVIGSRIHQCVSSPFNEGTLMGTDGDGRASSVGSVSKRI